MQGAEHTEPVVTAEGWLQLLSHLSDEELTRYAEIAHDQRRLEWRNGWAQGLCVVIAIGLGAWAIARMVTDGLSRQVVLVLGLAAAVGYWPYRKAKVRRLWAGHCKAVAEEQKRRAARGAPSSGERQSRAG